jgi:hypothetical protein
MKYFPDEPVTGAWARYAVAAVPLAYLILALVYAANSAPSGRQVDPESTYAMNGLAWAAGYPMMKNDHPGTTTILLTGLVIKLWGVLAGQSDVVEFGLKNFDAIIYARGAERGGRLLIFIYLINNLSKSLISKLSLEAMRPPRGGRIS